MTDRERWEEIHRDLWQRFSTDASHSDRVAACKRIAELERVEAELRWVDEQLAAVRAGVGDRTVLSLDLLSGLIDDVHNRKGMREELGGARG